MQVTAIFPVHPAVAELLTAQSQKIIVQMEEIDRLRQTIVTNEDGIKRLGCENFALGADKEDAETKLAAANSRLAILEQQNKDLQEICGHLRVSADAMEERANLTEQQLATADIRIRELEAALVLANLPESSRDNVIQLVREAA